MSQILKKFAALDANEQAWILGTLLDFRKQNLDDFLRKYGKFSQDLINKLIEDSPE